jgi:hypothetical protein
MDASADGGSFILNYNIQYDGARGEYNNVY